MAKHRVLVCCGTGIATSVQVSSKLRTMLKERGIDAELTECKAIELPSRAAAYHPQAIVSTTQVNVDIPGVTVFQGLPFLTGMGMDQAADQIADALRKAV